MSRPVKLRRCSLDLPNQVMCLLSHVRAFLLLPSRAPLHGILQKVLMFAPALKSARLSSRIPPKLSLAKKKRRKIQVRTVPATTR